jgi:hypothetical protein
MLVGEDVPHDLADIRHLHFRPSVQMRETLPGHNCLLASNTLSLTCACPQNRTR